MNIFLRTFNDSINSKTGSPLPQNAPRRGTPEWKRFEKILKDSFLSLGHTIFEQPENPNIPDNFGFMNSDECLGRPLRSVYTHKTKRDVPDGDLFWMQMHFKELFTIDRNGWGADHSVTPTPEQLFSEDETESKYFCENLSEKLIYSGISKCAQPEKTDETPEDFIFVPVQIPRDYTIANHSPVTVKYFLESIQAWAVETENHVCFKMHPFNKYDLDLHRIIEDAQKDSPFVHKVEGNIHELIKRSRGLFVINSGTGFEALVHGRPVATFGNCDYNSVTFNADLRRLDQACAFLREYRDEFRGLAYRFINWYWNKKAYDVNDKNTPERLTEYLKGVL